METTICQDGHAPPDAEKYRWALVAASWLGLLYSPFMKSTIIILLMACSALLSGCMMPNPEAQIEANESKLKAAGYIHPKIGESVADFSTTDESGNAFTLSQALADGPVMLFFYPANETPNSTNQLHQLDRLQLAVAEAGLGSIYGVNSAPAADTAVFLRSKGISLHVLSDPGLQISEAFGCASQDGTTQLQERSVVGIAQDSTVSFFQRRYFARPPSLKLLQGPEYYNIPVPEAPVQE